MRTQLEPRAKLVLLGIWLWVGMAATIGADTELVPLPVAFPSYSLKGNPDPIPDSPDFEKVSDKAPQLPLVSKGVMNVALRKPVKTSTNLFDHCRTEQVTDGEKEALDANVMEMKKGLQWVQVDLQGDYDIYAVVIWHRYSFRSIYKQVIVQVAQDEAFSKNVRTLFNNDRNNEAGFGVGSDLRYAETRYGRIIKGDGRPARFVRWYSNGSNDSALNTRLEMEVYGLPAKLANPAAK